MAKQKSRVYNRGGLGKMTTTEIKKRAKFSPEAREWLKKRGFTTSESANKAKMAKKAAGRFEKVKPSKEMLKKYKKLAKAKPAVKAVAKKTVGKAVGRALPGVGAAILARDVIKGVSKATCGKRGGKWVSGKCVGTKKTKYKPGAKVKDPISKR
jgi:hypothetical protein